jgi:hypothetical protein
MQVKGEEIESHISDKEASYQSTISVSYIKPTYQCCISTIKAAYQRCISARSFRSLSGQSHLGKLFKSRTFMVDIFK